MFKADEPADLGLTVSITVNCLKVCEKGSLFLEILHVTVFTGKNLNRIAHLNTQVCLLTCSMQCKILAHYLITVRQLRKCNYSDVFLRRVLQKVPSLGLDD